MVKISEKNNLFAIYWRLLRYVKPHGKLIVISIVLSFLVSVMHFASLAVFKPIGDCLFLEDKSIVLQILELGMVGEKIVSIFGEDFLNNRKNVLFVSICLLACAVLFKNILRFLHDYISSYIAAVTIIDMINDTFDKIIHANMQFFRQKRSASAINLLYRQIVALKDGIRLIFGKIQREPLKIVVSFVICFAISWSLSLIVFVVVPIVIGVVYYIGRKMRKKMRENIREDSSLLSLYQDIFYGIHTLKIFNMENLFTNQLHRQQENLLKKRMELAKYQCSTSPIVEILVSITGLVVLGISADMVIDKHMTPGDFFVFYAAVAVMVDPVRKLAGIYTKIVRCTTIAEKVFSLQDLAVLHREDNSGRTFEFHDKIEFKNVDFAYKKDKPVLKNVCFSVQKGEKIGVFGYNGSGKSTLGKMLVKFFTPQRGGIYIDGVNVNEYSTKSLRDQIAVVTQKSHLFELTIWDNICCGLPVERQKFFELSRNINILDFALEDDLQAVHGKDINFSGGQEQRLIILRALLKNSNILIFDEATSSLDKKSEAQTWKYLKDHCSSKTIFIISHKDTVLPFFDKLLVFDHGEVECFGDRDFVLQNSKVLQQLFRKNSKQDNAKQDIQ